MTWTTTRLKHLARVGYGLGQPPALSHTGIPILRATNIMRGKFTADGLIFAAREDLPLDRAPLLLEGEILVVRSGAYTGDSAMVTSTWAGSAPGYDLRVSPVGAHPAYIAYCLLSTVALDQMDLARNRAAQPHLNAEDLGDVTLRVPPVDEQRRIVGYLDAETARIDVLLAATDRQIELLNCRRLAAFRAMTTGIAEHVPSAATGIRWMPLMCGDWKLFKVGRSFKTGSGTTPRSSEPRFFGGPYPWINTGDLRDGFIQDPARSVSPAALQEYPGFAGLPVRHPHGRHVRGDDRARRHQLGPGLREPGMLRADPARSRGRDIRVLLVHRAPDGDSAARLRWRAAQHKPGSRPVAENPGAGFGGGAAEDRT